MRCAVFCFPLCPLTAVLMQDAWIYYLHLDVLLVTCIDSIFL